MVILDRIKKGLPEFWEQATIVINQYHPNSAWGGVLRVKYLADMCWCLLRYGARPIDYVRFQFYKKRSSERRKYLTIYKYFRLLKKFGYKETNVYGKIAEYQTFKEYIKRDWMVLDNNTSLLELERFITKNEVVFAKPNHGDQGHGVIKLSINDTSAVEMLMQEAKNKSFVIEGVVKNDEGISQINNTSLNTIRAYTLINKDGSTQILSIMLRVGRPGSHVDNWGSGGVGYNFDLDTGICVDYGRDKLNRPYTHHPGSNFQMVGFKLPRFEELKSTIVSLSQKTPNAKFVGWDIAITPSGFELIEMNCPGGHDFLQAFGHPFYHILKKEL